jgi:hypothetical protein
MTINDHHATCDGCPPSAPAITRVTSEWFKHWTRIEMQAGEEAHLCTECQKKQERGWLATTSCSNASPVEATRLIILRF